MSEEVQFDALAEGRPIDVSPGLQAIVLSIAKDHADSFEDRVSLLSDLEYLVREVIKESRG